MIHSVFNAINKFIQIVGKSVKHFTNIIGDEPESSFIDDEDIKDARIRFERLRSNHIPDKQKISDLNVNISERRLYNLNDNDDIHSDYSKKSI